MGGKGQLPNPSFEPYQCCPKPPARGSKVAKLQPKIGARQVTSKPAAKPAKKTDKPAPAPAPMKTVSKANHPLPPKPAGKEGKNGKEKVLPPIKGEKGKGKKGFFGTVYANASLVSVDHYRIVTRRESIANLSCFDCDFLFDFFKKNRDKVYFELKHRFFKSSPPVELPFCIVL
ncbi:hypothetical protein NQ315_003014 [Exocentrus adspersus]|uniref:Uncharacterized protein n=1 Tax=Exocentrus adspersus TaxID=1586481 RepID=A0AAV8W406_9CUCU|nr:hypothetical protein NQ315_003014 [Exocentrus adspersus]